MFDSCGVQHLLCFGCLGWAWKRCTRAGADDSKDWAPVCDHEFRPVPRICRLILAAYEQDLGNPKWAPPDGYNLNPDWLVKRTTYDQTMGHCPPYLIYVDHDHRELVVAIRGLNLAHEKDYYILLDNRRGMQTFDGGYVHRGFMKAAAWLLDQESETLRKLWVENGSCYRLVFAGHSLGSGVAALITLLVLNHRERLGGLPRRLIGAYAVAPARCVSLNLAVRYSDAINSVVLQDDFFPRTSTPVEDHLKVICCMPCFFFVVWIRDVFMASCRMKDARRLHVPGRLFHIVNRKFFRIGRFPPTVKTAIPIDRFEYIILSCNASSDHEIVWIEREAQKALDRMTREEETTHPPRVQMFERRGDTVTRNVGEQEAIGMLDTPISIEPAENRHGSIVQNLGAETLKDEANSHGLTWSDLVDMLLSADFQSRGGLNVNEEAVTNA